MSDESQYWIDLTNRQSNHLFDLHNSEMSAQLERQDYNLFEFLKPSLMIDGDQYEVLYGTNPMEGVAGYGKTPHLAILDFNKSWHQACARVKS